MAPVRNNSTGPKFVGISISSLTGFLAIAFLFKGNMFLVRVLCNFRR